MAAAALKAWPRLLLALAFLAVAVGGPSRPGRAAGEGARVWKALADQSPPSQPAKPAREAVPPAAPAAPGLPAPLVAVILAGIAALGFALASLAGAVRRERRDRREALQRQPVDRLAGVGSELERLWRVHLRSRKR